MRAASAVLTLVLAVSGAVPADAVGAESSAGPSSAGPSSGADWAWPLSSFRLDRPYIAPAHPYGPGHRGIDLATTPGAAVRAPSGGAVAFVGDVAGRGILTIDHGGGLVTTLEPVESALEVGAAVTRGQEVATVSSGGHAAPSSIHFGVRLDGEYINPMILLGGVPRAVLLPCC